LLNPEALSSDINFGSRELSLWWRFIKLANQSNLVFRPLVGSSCFNNADPVLRCCRSS
jgi:hypothetical protein